MLRLATLILFTGLLGACAQYDSQRGVDVTWERAALDQFEVGTTTRQEVLSRLGPPSQLIALDGETVLYYLFERAEGEGLILLAYNRFSIDTRYDRAVFIFDQQDRLTEYAAKIHDDND